MMTNILEMMQGKVHFYLFVGGSPAIEIKIHNKEIIAEIKNPLLALELGIHQLATNRKSDSYILKQAKKAGYKVRVKYKMLEIEL
ncbi:MAG: hypothetical protein JXC85_03805 [Candidatus Aenigmarchaeota archaeon]|nr:hypothetical protein [Candidatus Aenigmarchaeota archaeon]